MNAEFITAVIGALSTIIGAIISGLVAIRVSSKQHDKTVALVDYRLEQLEKKVDKHNNLVERMTSVETKLNMLKGRYNG